MRKRTMFDVDALFRARNQFWVRATYRDVPTEAANVIPSKLRCGRRWQCPNTPEMGMRDLVREGEAEGVGTFASDLLEWMGAAFGDAVQRARPQRLGGYPTRESDSGVTRRHLHNRRRRSHHIL